MDKKTIMKRLSIISCTKDRHSLLEKQIKSIDNLSKNRDSVEYIITCNDDDYPTIDFVKSFDNPNIILLPCEYDPLNRNFHRDMYGKGFLISTGDYIWGLPGDCEILTQDYDAVIENEFENFLSDKKDRICYGSIDDSATKLYHNNSNMCAAPILTRELASIFKSTMPMEIPHQGADWALYHMMCNICDSRILCIENLIKIHHHSHYNNSYELDHIYRDKPQGRTQLTMSEMMNYISTINTLILDKK